MGNFARSIFDNAVLTNSIFGYSAFDNGVGARIVATNNNVFPVQLDTATTNNYQHNFKKRRVAGTVLTTYKRLYFTYTNFYVFNGGETNGAFAFDISMGVRDAAGVWHQGLCNGSATATVAPGSSVTFAVDINCAGGDDILEVNRVVGPASSSQYLLSHPAAAYRGEGRYQSTNPAIDMTMGGSGTNAVGFGATCTANLTAGGVSSVTITNGGSGYSTGGNTSIQFIAQNAAGNGANYATTVSGGAVTGGYQNATGSSFTVAPTAYINSCGAVTPSDTMIYAAAIVSGVPATGSIPSVLLLGDSRSRGYTSADGFGTLKGNYGTIERTIDSAYGILNLSVSSMTSQAFVSTKQYAAIAANGVSITHAIIAFGINDITGGASFNTLANAQSGHATYWRARGAKIIFTTLEPSTTSTDSWATLANQTASTGCGVGGVRDTYNAAVRAGTDSRITGDHDVIDISSIVEAQAEPQKWRVDTGAAMTADGVHLSGWSIATAKSGTTYNFLSATKGLDYLTANKQIFDYSINYTTPMWSWNFKTSPSIPSNMAYTAASRRSYYGSDGLLKFNGYNLLTYSNGFTNAIWVNFGSVSITPNAGISPNGDNTATRWGRTTSSSSRISQGLTKSTSSLDYTASIYVKKGVGNYFSLRLQGTYPARADVSFDLSNGIISTAAYSTGAFSNASATIKYIANGFYRVTLSTNTDTASAIGLFLSFNSNNIPIDGTDSSATSYGYIWGAQLEQNISAGEYSITTSSANSSPRFSYSYNGTSWVPDGYLSEQQATNLFLYSDVFDGASWTRAGSGAAAPTVTANQATDPAGGTAADKIVYPAVSSGGAWSILLQRPSQADGAYTASIWMKGNVGGEVVYITLNPTSADYATTQCTLTTSWQRFDVTKTRSGVDMYFQIGVDLRDGTQSAKGAQTIYVYGAQLETGSVATSYIQTGSAQATRSADVLTGTLSSVIPSFQNRRGALYAEFSAAGNAATIRRVMNIDDASSNNSQSLSVNASDLSNGTTVSGGSSIANIQVTKVTPAKLAYSYAVNDIRFYANATAGTAVASGVMPTGLTTFRIGCGGSNTEQTQGTIASISYYAHPLYNGTMQSLTS